jgi:hypothetical protein
MVRIEIIVIITYRRKQFCDKYTDEIGISKVDQKYQETCL